MYCMGFGKQQKITITIINVAVVPHSVMILVVVPVEIDRFIRETL